MMEGELPPLPSPTRSYLAVGEWSRRRAHFIRIAGIAAMRSLSDTPPPAREMAAHPAIGLQWSPSAPGPTGAKRVGDLAQLGERFHGMEEVTGSNPVISTKSSSIQTLDPAVDLPL